MKFGGLNLLSLFIISPLPLPSLSPFYLASWSIHLADMRSTVPVQTELVVAKHILMHSALKRRDF